MSLWQSAAERAGAVDGVLRVGGAARLLDASCVSSRNTELLNGQSFLQTGFGGRRPTEPCISPIQWLGAASAGARAVCSFAPSGVWAHLQPHPVIITIRRFQAHF